MAYPTDNEDSLGWTDEELAEIESFQSTDDAEDPDITELYALAQLARDQEAYALWEDC